MMREDQNNDYVIEKYGSKQVAQIITYGKWLQNHPLEIQPEF